MTIFILFGLELSLLFTHLLKPTVRIPHPRLINTSTTSQHPTCIQHMNTTICPSGYQSNSMWTNTKTCHIHTATKTIMEFICIVVGSINTLITCYILFQQLSNDKNTSSIQKTERLLFLLHSLIHNIVQILIFSLALAFDTDSVNQRLMAVLLAALGFGVMGGTLHACALWFFILPLRFLRQRPAMIRWIGTFFDSSLRMGAIYFVLYFLTIIPTFLEQFRLTSLLIQVLIFVTTLVPVYLILLAAGLLHDIMQSTTTTTNTNSSCLRLTCNLLCFQHKLQTIASRRSDVSRRASNHDQVTRKLKISAIIMLLLGSSALCASLVIGLFTVAFHQPHVFYSAECLTGCAWELFIYFMFFRVPREPVESKSSAKEIYMTGEVVSNTYEGVTSTLEGEISSARSHAKKIRTSSNKI